MLLGFKQFEEHGRGYLHLVDLTTARGVVCGYDDGEWTVVRQLDVEGVDGKEATIDFLARRLYVPTKRIPYAEFNGLYEKLSIAGQPLAKCIGDFKPTETPQLAAMVNEACA